MVKTFEQFLFEDKRIKFIHFPSSFREIDEHSIKNSKEELEHLSNTQEEIDPIHDHSDVKPKGLTLHFKQKRAIRDYSSVGSYDNGGHSSSGNMNAWLRNKAGDKRSKIVPGNDPKKVEESMRTLSSIFTPKNTNKVKLVTYGAVPANVGKKFRNSAPGTESYLPGFISSTTKKKIAHDFADKYSYDDEEEDNFGQRHIVVYHLHPGTGVSIVHHVHPDYAHENEILINHGNRVTYLKSEKKGGVHFHHIEVHPDGRKSLENYGDYN